MRAPEPRFGACPLETNPGAVDREARAKGNTPTPRRAPQAPLTGTTTRRLGGPPGEHRLAASHLPSTELACFAGPFSMGRPGLEPGTHCLEGASRLLAFAAVCRRSPLKRRSGHDGDAILLASAAFCRFHKASTRDARALRCGRWRSGPGGSRRRGVVSGHRVDPRWSANRRGWPCR
jgi:hypothetical protein